MNYQHGFSYPDSFKRIFKQGLLDFDPWIIMGNENLRTRYVGLKNDILQGN